MRSLSIQSASAPFILDFFLLLFFFFYCLCCVDILNKRSYNLTGRYCSRFDILSMAGQQQGRSVPGGVSERTVDSQHDPTFFSWQTSHARTGRTFGVLEGSMMGAILTA